MRAGLNQLHHSKKSQTEVFGIVIVVILVMIGMGFAIKSMLAPQKSTSEDFKKAHLSQDLLNAISISSTSGSCALDMSGLIKECFTGGTTCGDPCAIAKTDLGSILESTLVRQNLAYRLRIYVNDPENPDIDILSKSDPGNPGSAPIDPAQIGRAYLVKERPGTLTLPTGAGGNVNVILQIFTIRQVFSP